MFGGALAGEGDGLVVSGISGCVCCHSRASCTASSAVSAADDDLFSKINLFLAI